MGRGLVIGLLVLAATAMGALMRPSAASSGREDEMRDQLGQFLNLERANRGLRALPLDEDLSAQAQAWSEHDRQTGCATSCHSPHSQGEIIAWGGPNARSGQLVGAWMESSSHRDILLYPDATAMGVGLACSDNGEAYATVQYYGVHHPVPATDTQPIASAKDWGAPCAGPEGPVPPTSTSTPTTSNRTTTTTTARTPRPRPSTTTTGAPAALVAPPTTTTSTASTSTTTTTAVPRVALRADGPHITAPPPDDETAAFLASSAATPANAEPAWIAIVVVVVLLSGMRIGAQVQELRAARRSEES